MEVAQCAGATITIRSLERRNVRARQNHEHRDGGRLTHQTPTGLSRAIEMTIYEQRYWQQCNMVQTLLASIVWVVLKNVLTYKTLFSITSHVIGWWTITIPHWSACKTYIGQRRGQDGSRGQDEDKTKICWSMEVVKNHRCSCFQYATKHYSHSNFAPTTKQVIS